MPTYSLSIPGIPKSLNQIGSRGGWQAFHRHKKQWENDLWLALTAAKVPRDLGRVDATAVLYPTTNRRRDEGNHRVLLEKALGDALQLGGWLPDDTPEFFSFGRLTFGEKRELPLTVVELVCVAAGAKAA